MKGIIQVAVVLVLGILVYNFFFGTSEEKTQSKEIFKKTGETLGATWNLLKSEKAKFDAGKYDKVLDKLGGAYRAVREQAQFVDKKVLKRLDDLETRKTQLQGQLDSIEQTEQQLNEAPAPKRTISKADQRKEAELTAAKLMEQAKKKEQLMHELDQLVRDTESLLKAAQSGE